MTLSPEILDAMVESGCTAQQIAAVVKASLATQSQSQEEKRLRDRERQRAHRAKKNECHIMSQGVTPCHSDNCDKKEEKEKSTKKEKEEPPFPKEKPPKGVKKKKVFPQTQENPSIAVQGQGQSPPENQEFEGFWVKYQPFDMTKGSKKTALKNYEKARKQGVSHETIIGGLERYIAYCHATACRTKHASTWLNQHGWEDDYTIPPTGNGAGSSVGQRPDQNDSFRNRVNATSAEIDHILGDTPCQGQAHH